MIKVYGRQQLPLSVESVSKVVPAFWRKCDNYTLK